MIRLTETKINAELAKIDEWLKINKLSLNLKKSKYMVFKKTSITNINLTLTIDKVVIDSSFVQFSNIASYKLLYNGLGVSE